MVFSISFSFFFNDPATTEIYTLSLHDALPICILDQPLAFGVERRRRLVEQQQRRIAEQRARDRDALALPARSEEHTSELQSQFHLVCRLLLEKKKKKNKLTTQTYVNHNALNTI